MLSLEASLGRKLRDEIKSALNLAALLVFASTFASVLSSDLQAMGPVGQALATPLSAAGKLASGGLPGLLIGLVLSQLLLSLSSRDAEASGPGAQGRKPRGKGKSRGNAFLFPEPQDK